MSGMVHENWMPNWIFIISRNVDGQSTASISSRTKTSRITPTRREIQSEFRKIHQKNSSTRWTTSAQIFFDSSAAIEEIFVDLFTYTSF